MRSKLTGQTRKRNEVEKKIEHLKIELADLTRLRGMETHMSGVQQRFVVTHDPPPSNQTFILTCIQVHEVERRKRPITRKVWM